MVHNLGNGQGLLKSEGTALKYVIGGRVTYSKAPKNKRLNYCETSPAFSEIS